MYDQSLSRIKALFKDSVRKLKRLSGRNDQPDTRGRSRTRSGIDYMGSC